MLLRVAARVQGFNKGAGPTWSSRLWCCVELFVFVQMGKKSEDITVWQLEASGAPLVCAARHAKCSSERDRQALLGAIEASFGELAAFDAEVNAILHEHATNLQHGQGGTVVEMSSVVVEG